MSTNPITIDQIRTAAYGLAQRHGYAQITRALVAEQIGCSVATVRYVLGRARTTFPKIQDELREAGLPPGDFGQTTANCPDLRRAAVMAKAVELAEQVGYRHIQRTKLAKAAGVSVPWIYTHFGTLDEIRALVMAQAVESENLRILAQGLADGHPVAAAAPEELRRKAAATLAGNVADAQ